LLKYFNEVARKLEAYPQAVLIMQRKGAPLVLVNADIWEQFLHERFNADLEREQRLRETPEPKAADLKL